MRWARGLVAVVIAATTLAGCGDEDTEGDLVPVGSDAPADAPLGDAGDVTAGEGGAAVPSFCEAVAALEVSSEEDEPALAAALEADTPAGLEDAVAVVREYTDRRQAGEDVFQDADFLLAYDGAVRDLIDACG